MYEICKEMSFAAAHIIRGHPGKCAQPHGHNWRVRLHVSCEGLDAIGMGIEFGSLKEALAGILESLDHRDLNDLPMFQGTNPTAENMARYIFEEASRRLKQAGCRVSRVEIWETDSCSVTYAP